METYEVFAIRYATRDALRSAHFIGGDPHDGPMPMDYFVWLVRNASRTVVVDTGFTADMAQKRKRTFLRTPTEGLALIGVDAEDGEGRGHHPHALRSCRHVLRLPRRQFHLQDLEMNFATGRYMRHGRFNHGYEVEDVVGMVRLVFGDRVRFHAGAAELAPGISVHHIGGHTMGLQACAWPRRAAGWCWPPTAATTTSTWSRPRLHDDLPRRRHDRGLRQAAALAEFAAAHHPGP